MKPGEPQWANAVQSRRWELEETLERDRVEMLATREAGTGDPYPATCMTESQDRAYRLALESLALMREYDGEDTDMENTDTEQSNKQGMNEEGI
jgi:hypothetical protein